MTKEHKQKLLAVLGEERARREAIFHQARRGAISLRGASRSQQGDRAIAENSAEVAKNVLQSTDDLISEIQSSGDGKITLVTPPCYLRISDNTGSEKEYYYFSKGAKIGNLLFLSPESPLGAALYNKHVGDKYFYALGGRNFSGEIIVIE